MQTSKRNSKTSGSIFLFVPNLIGYARIILLLLFFYLMPNASSSAILYILSQLLDAIDGYAARSLNQGTMFGAVLDMVTDRVSTLGLLIMLSNFYSDYTFIFQLLCVLDISSHWFQMYSTLLCGEQNHKNMTGNIFLRFYYTNRVCLFVMCAGNELFFVMCYILYFRYGPLINIFGDYKGLFEVICMATFPFCVAKQILSVIQLFTAIKRIADVDAEKREKTNQPR